MVCELYESSHERRRLESFKHRWFHGEIKRHAPTTKLIKNKNLVIIMVNIKTYIKAVKKEGTPLKFAIADFFYMVSAEMKFTGKSVEMLQDYYASLEKLAEQGITSHKDDCERAVIENLIY